jgi:hypothetical protein
MKIFHGRNTGQTLLAVEEARRERGALLVPSYRAAESIVAAHGGKIDTMVADGTVRYLVKFDGEED